MRSRSQGLHPFDLLHECAYSVFLSVHLFTTLTKTFKSCGIVFLYDIGTIWFHLFFFFFFWHILQRLSCCRCQIIIEAHLSEMLEAVNLEQCVCLDEFISSDLILRAKYWNRLNKLSNCKRKSIWQRGECSKRWMHVIGETFLPGIRFCLWGTSESAALRCVFGKYKLRFFIIGQYTSHKRHSLLD